jgi:hypothetical protein
VTEEGYERTFGPLAKNDIMHMGIYLIAARRSPGRRSAPGRAGAGFAPSRSGRSIDELYRPTVGLRDLVLPLDEPHRIAVSA